MANLILDNGEFSKGLKFEPRASGHGISHGPVYGSAGYLALRIDQNGRDTGVYLIKSTDGITWTEVSHNIDLLNTQIQGLKYLNNLYVIYGLEVVTATNKSYIRVNTSTNGTTWTSYRVESSVGIRGLTEFNYSNNVWQVFGRSTSGLDMVFFTSTNLTTWTWRSNTTDRLAGGGSSYQNYSFEGIAVNGTTSIAVGYAWRYNSTTGAFIEYRPYISTSTNGTTRTHAQIGGTLTSPGWKPSDIAYGNNLWVIVGSGGNLMTSADGGVWTYRTTNTTSDFICVDYYNGVWIALHSTGTLRSTNGTTWTPVTRPEIESDDLLYFSNGNRTNAKATYVSSKWILGDWQSIDNGLTWTILDFQIPNKQPFLVYPYEPSWNTWKTIDFWVFIEFNPMDFQVFGIAGHRGSWGISINTQNTGAVELAHWSNNMTANSVVSRAQVQNEFIMGAWNHIRIVDNGTQAASYVNGTRKVLTTRLAPRPVSTDTLNVGINTYSPENRYAREPAYFIDEFMMTDELLNSPSATTIAVPTQPFINNEYTSLLLHFDTDFNDDPSYPARVGEAAFTSAFSEVTNISVIRKFSSSISSTATVNAQVTTAKDLTANLAAQFSLSTSALDLDLANINLSSQFQITANTKVNKPTSASLSLETNLSSTGLRIVQGNANLEVNGFVMSTAARSQQFGAFIETSSSLSIDAVKLAVAPIGISSAFTSVVNASAVLFSPANMQVTSRLSVETEKVYALISTESVVTEMSTTAIKTSRAVANIAVQSSLDLSTSNYQVASGSLFDNCSLSVGVTVTRTINANLLSTTEQITVTNTVVRAEADLVVSAFELAIAKAFNLDDSATWIIPSENTTWIISKDNRLWNIQRENREYKI